MASVFLSFAQREDRHQNATAARENATNRVREPPLLRRPRKIFGQRRGAMRRLDDQDIDTALGKDSVLHDCLIVKVDIARVEHGASFRAEKNAGGPEHMPGIHKFESNFW